MLRLLSVADFISIINAIFGILAIIVLFIDLINSLELRIHISLSLILIGLLVTILPIYILNLFRNVLVVFLLVRNITDFNIAHNIIAKVGSLVAMIILLLIVIKIIPEVFNKILSLTEIYKRNGPLEKIFKKIIWRKT